MRTFQIQDSLVVAFSSVEEDRKFLIQDKGKLTEWIKINKTEAMRNFVPKKFDPNTEVILLER